MIGDQDTLTEIEQHGWELIADDYEITEFHNDDYTTDDGTTVRNELVIDDSNTHKGIIVHAYRQYYEDFEIGFEPTDHQTLGKTTAETIGDAVEDALWFASEFNETLNP